MDKAIEIRNSLEMLREKVNFHHLHYFLILSKVGSIRKASERLLLSPATISRQIRELESQLGTSLLVRTSQSIRLTEAGEYVQRYCEELFGLAQEMVDGLQGNSEIQPVRLTVGVSGMIPKLAVSRLLQPVLAMPKPLQIVCQDVDRAPLFEDFSNHRVDIVLSDAAYESRQEKQVVSRRISSTPASVCGNQKLAQKFRGRFPKSLHGAPVLLPWRSSSMRKELDTYFQQEGVMPKVRGEFDDSTSIKVFGEAGLGLFFVPALIEDEVTHRFRCEVIGRLESVTFSVYLTTLSRKAKHPIVAAICRSASDALVSSQSLESDR